MKILSLNGGGTLGYITLCNLVKLENEAEKPCHQIFDLIAGVSTGSIIGYSLASGLTALETKMLYKKLIPKIFNSKTGFFMSLFKPYYKIDELAKIIKDNTNNKKLSDVKTKFMCHSTQISKPEVTSKFWKSWKDDNIKAWQALAASSAAPLYFSPFEINGDIFIDGGLSSNSPNTPAIIEAIKFGHDLNDIKMLNLTINTLRYYNRKNDLIGLLRVANNFPPIAVWGTETIEIHQAEKLLKDKNFRAIYPKTKLEIDSQDFIKMQNIADALWHERKEDYTCIL